MPHPLQPEWTSDLVHLAVTAITVYLHDNAMAEPAVNRQLCVAKYNNPLLDGIVSNKTSNDPTVVGLHPCISARQGGQDKVGQPHLAHKGAICNYSMTLVATALVMIQLDGCSANELQHVCICVVACAAETATLGLCSPMNVGIATMHQSSLHRSPRSWRAAVSENIIMGMDAERCRETSADFRSAGSTFKRLHAC